MFKSAVVLGCWIDGKELMINPSEDYVIQKNDWMVGIASNMESFEPQGKGFVRVCCSADLCSSSNLC